MATTANILERRKTHFLLWRPSNGGAAPELIIGKLQEGNPPTFAPVPQQPFKLKPVQGADGLWAIAAADCQLTDGGIYHYWFRVEDSRSTSNPKTKASITDPFAFTADWRLFPPGSTENAQPAAVIRFQGGKLIPCDPRGETALFK